MAAGPWLFTDTTRQKILDGTFDMDTSSWKMALFTSTSNIGPTSTTYAGLTGELTPVFEYATGGQVCAFTVESTGAPNWKARLTRPALWAFSTSTTAKWAVIYKVGGDVLCYCLLDGTGASVTIPAGGALQIVASAAGVFALL